MKQKIYDIPIWDAYKLDNIECPLCEIQNKVEKDFMDVLYDDMLMTPYFAQKLQQYDFCREHYKKLYAYKDKLGLALIVNNFLQCQKESLQGLSKVSLPQHKVSTFKKIKYFFKGIKHDHLSASKPCYLCERINGTMPEYVNVLINLWNDNKEFRELYKKSKGHCLKHYNELLEGAEQYLNSSKFSEFRKATIAMQLDNTARLIDELDWFVCKYDYRYKDEPWKNSKDALPRCITKLSGSFNDQKD